MAEQGEEKGRRERKGGEKKAKKGGDASPGIEPRTFRMESQNSNC